MKPISDKLQEAFVNTRGFGGGVTKAVLNLQLVDGSTMAVDFGSVRSIDLSSGMFETTNFGGGNPWFDKVYGNPETTVTIRGIVRETTLDVPKEKKPVPKPKVPTVKTSSLRLRKADKAATLATNKLLKLEAALQNAKVVKGLADTERKLATEALLASAIS